MKLKALVIAIFCAAIVLMTWPYESSGNNHAYTVAMSAYTCEVNPRNPMHPCGPLRWGGNIYERGLACLDSWRGWYIEIPGFGTYRCDDTMGRAYASNGLPRLDVRVPTLAEARRIGLRRITVYHVNPRAQQRVPVPTATYAAPSLPTAAPAAPAAPTVAAPAAPAPAAPAAPAPPAPTVAAPAVPTSPPPPPSPPPTATAPPTSTATPIPTATPVPPPDWTTAQGVLQLAHKQSPDGDPSTAMIRLLRVETVEAYAPALLEGITTYKTQPLWLVSLWVAPEHIPYNTLAYPNSDGEIAGQFFLFDANSGELINEMYVSNDVLDFMGWIPDDQIDLSHVQK